MKNTHTILISTISILCIFNLHNLQAETGNGSKISPYKTIEQALAIAKEGDTIHIVAGKYIPIDTSFKVNKSVVIIGGYDETFSETNFGITFLSENTNGGSEFDEVEKLVLSYENNPYPIISLMNETTNIVIENVKIQKGYTGLENASKDGSFISVVERRLKINSDMPFDYILYDTQGRNIQSAKSQNPKSTIDFSNLQEGLYLVHVNSGNKKQLLKFIL